MEGLRMRSSTPKPKEARRSEMKTLKSEEATRASKMSSTDDEDDLFNFQEDKTRFSIDEEKDNFKESSPSLRELASRESDAAEVRSNHSLNSYVSSVPQKDLVPAFRHQLEIEERPRQIMVASIIIIGLLGGSFFVEKDHGANIRHCLLATMFVMCCYCMVQLRDSVLVRPHPAVWRFLHGWKVWYLLLISILLMLPSSTAKELVNLAFPEIRESAAASSGFRPVSGDNDKTALGAAHLDCSINGETIMRQFTSFWNFAHVVGWWAKMVILRDWHLCLLFSTFFEFTELTFQYGIPEFQECWWDSIFMDALCANMTGMILGRLTLHFLMCRQYDWTPWRDVHGVKQVTYRWVQQFSPYSWSEYRWNSSQTIRNYLLQALIIVLCIAMDLNSFLIVETFRIPPPHYVCFTRTFFMCLCTVPAIHEWHHYVVGDATRIGYSTWTLAIILILEIALYWKYTYEQMGDVFSRSATIPMSIYACWIAFAVLQLIYCIQHYRLQKQAKKERRRWSVPRSLRYFRLASFLPLLGLTAHYKF